MTSGRARSRAASYVFARAPEGALRRLRTTLTWAVLTSAAGCGQVGTAAGGCCQRALLATLVPKLDLRWHLERAASRDNTHGGHVVAGFGAFLRWQPASSAAQVPRRFELSPSAWASPCELDDVTCFAELAETERGLAEALQEER